MFLEAVYFYEYENAADCLLALKVESERRMPFNIWKSRTVCVSN